MRGLIQAPLKLPAVQARPPHVEAPENVVGGVGHCLAAHMDGRHSADHGYDSAECAACLHSTASRVLISMKLDSTGCEMAHNDLGGGSCILLANHVVLLTLA